MDIRLALVGIAFLVVASFWAVVLTVLPYAIGIIVIFSAIFAVFLAVGVNMLVNAMGLGSNRVREKRTSRDPKGLTALDIIVLQMTSQSKTQQEIVSATGVAPSVIADKLESLTRAGLLSGSSLSEKGFEALKASS